MLKVVEICAYARALLRDIRLWVRIGRDSKSLEVATVHSATQHCGNHGMKACHLAIADPLF